MSMAYTSAVNDGGSASGNFKILSAIDCIEILEDLKKIDERCDNFMTNFDSGIKKFEACSIVQSFYASGEFGREKEERIKQIRTELEKFFDAINRESTSLIPRTKRIIEEQQDRLNRRGGPRDNIGEVI